MLVRQPQSAEQHTPRLRLFLVLRWRRMGAIRRQTALQVFLPNPSTPGTLRHRRLCISPLYSLFQICDSLEHITLTRMEPQQIL